MKNSVCSKIIGKSDRLVAIPTVSNNNPVSVNVARWRRQHYTHHRTSEEQANLDREIQRINRIAFERGLLVSVAESLNGIRETARA